MRSIFKCKVIYSCFFTSGHFSTPQTLFLSWKCSILLNMWSMASLARSKYSKVHSQHLFTLATRRSVNTSCLKQKRNRTGIIHARLSQANSYGLNTLVTSRFYSKYSFIPNFSQKLSKTPKIKNGYFDKKRVIPN